MILSHGNAYELWVNHKNGWNAEIFRDRYNDVLDRYDYIVGDWGYNQLRLKGFFKENHTKATKELSIQALNEYLSEYCNFGCAYFVLERQPDKHGTVRIKSSYEETEAEWYDLPPKKPTPPAPVQTKPGFQKQNQQQRQNQNAQPQQSQQSQQSVNHQKQQQKPFQKQQQQQQQPTMQAQGNQTSQDPKRPPKFRDREHNRDRDRDRNRNHNHRNPRRREQESTDVE